MCRVSNVARAGSLAPVKRWATYESRIHSGIANVALFATRDTVTYQLVQQRWHKRSLANQNVFNIGKVHELLP